MSIVALIIFLFTAGVAGLIIYNTYLALQKSSLKNKKDHLKLVDEQYEEMVLVKKQHKNMNEKEKQLNKFTKE